MDDAGILAVSRCPAKGAFGDDIRRLNQERTDDNPDEDVESDETPLSPLGLRLKMLNTELERASCDASGIGATWGVEGRGMVGRFP